MLLAPAFRASGRLYYFVALIIQERCYRDITELLRKEKTLPGRTVEGFGLPHVGVTQPSVSDKSDTDQAGGEDGEEAKEEQNKMVELFHHRLQDFHLRDPALLVVFRALIKTMAANGKRRRW